MANDDITKNLAIDTEKFRDASWGANQLKRIPIFKSFSSEELGSLYAHGKIVVIKPGVNAVIEGEPSRGLFVLLSGTVSVYKNDPASGSMHRLTYLEEGSYFGEFSLFDTAPRSATVTAENTCYLFQLDVDKFGTFMHKAGLEAQVRFYKTCSEQLSERLRNLNNDYIVSQKILWKYALRRAEKSEAEQSG